MEAIRFMEAKEKFKPHPIIVIVPVTDLFVKKKMMLRNPNYSHTLEINR